MRSQFAVRLAHRGRRRIAPFQLGPALITVNTLGVINNMTMPRALCAFLTSPASRPPASSILTWVNIKHLPVVKSSYLLHPSTLGPRCKEWTFLRSTNSLAQSLSHRGNIKETAFVQSRSRWTICPAQVDYISQWPTKDQITQFPASSSPTCLSASQNSTTRDCWVIWVPAGLQSVSPPPSSISTESLTHRQLTETIIKHPVHHLRTCVWLYWSASLSLYPPRYPHILTPNKNIKTQK